MYKFNTKPPQKKIIVYSPKTNTIAKISRAIVNMYASKQVGTLNTLGDIEQVFCLTHCTYIIYIILS